MLNKVTTVAWSPGPLQTFAHTEAWCKEKGYDTSAQVIEYL